MFCRLYHDCICTWSDTFFCDFSLQNLPRDALPDGSPIREKLATFKRPKKLKTSENDFSHGSFFLRIGGIGKCKSCLMLAVSWQSTTALTKWRRNNAYRQFEIPILCSFRTRHNDLQWTWAWNIFRDPLGLTLLPSATRNQSHSPNDLHFQPNVFRIHERQGEN